MPGADIVTRDAGPAIIVRVSVDAQTHPALHHYLSTLPDRRRAEAFRLFGELALRREPGPVAVQPRAPPAMAEPDAEPSISAAFSAGIGMLLGSVDATRRDRAVASERDE